MPFPLGGDFTRSVNSTFKVLKSDNRICRHENGTTICDLGHKLKFPGTCLSQPIGAFNSTDATFQPTFLVCTTDYQSSGFNPGVIISRGLIDGAGTVFSKDNEVSNDALLVQLQTLITGACLTFSMEVALASTLKIVGVPTEYSGATFAQSVDSLFESFFRLAQFNPGSLPHIPNVYSDLFVYDVVGSTPEYARQVFHFVEAATPRIMQEDVINFNQNLIVRDDEAVVGEVDICEGDESPPIITYIQPTASGTVLRPPTQEVEFTLADSPGGVDISKLYIGISSTTSGTYNIVSAGVDLTGGQVSITGDSSSYLIRYNPNFVWENNDRVVVTISGADLPPVVDGNPFYCGAAGVNYFIGDIHFKVRTPMDMGASLTAIGDVDPPYIASASPASGTVGANVFAPVIIVISDDLTGIDLSTLTVVVDTETIVFEGLATTSEVQITGSASSYTVTYNKTNAFEYGSLVEVHVYAEDRTRPTGNILDTSYTFLCIDDGTLRIENFTPAIGTTVNPDTIDIEVDIIDDTYGVDSAQSLLIINGSIVGATVSTITSGIHFTYHPPNDFAYDRPIVVKVLGVNDNPSAPAVKESIYTLYYGQRILLHNGGPYGHGQQVDVFVHARNMERLHKDLSTGYLFTAYSQPRSDIGASLECITPYADVGASITAQGPEHRYGQTVTVTFYVEDFEGHALGPYTYTYTIEEE